MLNIIPLSQGKYTIVDPEDYEYLSQFKWFLMSRGYAARNVRMGDKRTLVTMHRVIANRMGLDLSKLIDHINRNKLDNRRSNIRSATPSQSTFNRQLPQGKPGFRGVYWVEERNKWTAKIKVKGKDIRLGYFDDINKAIERRKQGEVELYGEFAETVKIAP